MSGSNKKEMTLPQAYLLAGEVIAITGMFAIAPVFTTIVACALAVPMFVEKKIKPESNLLDSLRGLKPELKQSFSMVGSDLKNRLHLSSSKPQGPRP